MKKTTTITIALTLAYIVCELIYNLGLVDFLSSKNTEITVFNRLEFFGKSLSAIGISLFLIKVLPTKRTIHRLAAFTALVPIVFIVESAVFDHLIDSLAPEKKAQAYALGVYRNAVLNGHIPSPVSSPLALATIGLSSKLDSDQVRSQVSDFLQAKFDSDAIGSFYGQYREMSSKLDAVYASYAIESKRWNGYKGKMKEKVDQEFIKKAGVPQGLSRDEFMAAIGESSPALKQFRTTEIIPAIPKFGIAAVRGADIPFGLSEGDFRALFEQHIATIREKSSISAANVESLPHARELIASIYIPPLAIGLSLLSILLNLSTVLVAVHRGLVAIPVGIVAFSLYTSSMNPLGAVMAVESQLLRVAKPITAIIHQVAINDENPNEADIIRIKKPEPVDMSDLESKLSDLKQSVEVEAAGKTDEQITADPDRLKNEQGYYGEIRGKINPYTGKPYK